MTPTFAIVMGVSGRPTLRQSLDSIAAQERVSDDRVIVCVDAFEQGSRPDIKALVESYGEGFECCALDAGYHFFGVEQCNYATSLVDERTTHVMSMGDDDVYADGAFAALRAVCAEDPLRPVLFRFLLTGYGLLWDVPAMRRCHISGQCIVGPREFVGFQNTRHDCTVDFDWMSDTIRRSKREPLWLDYVGVIAHSDGKRRKVWRCWSCGGHGYVGDVSQACCGRAVDVNPAPRIVAPHVDEVGA